jgi:hypothetical protein
MGDRIPVGDHRSADASRRRHYATGIAAGNRVGASVRAENSRAYSFGHRSTRTGGTPIARRAALGSDTVKGPVRSRRVSGPRDRPELP